jgi:hypothetical protein
MGLRTGVVGWYHPYCRVLGQSADSCYWEEYNGRAAAAWDVPSRALNLLQKTWFVAAKQLQAYPVVASGGDAHDRQIATSLFLRIRAKALDTLRNPDLDVVFIHWPIPHPPGVSWPGRHAPLPGYLDNLELTDRIVGEVRQTLEDRGLWDRTLLMITSDHSLRPDLWNSSGLLTAEDQAAAGQHQHPLVPFLLKMPGQKHGIAFDRPIPLSTAADLTIHVLAGRLKNADDLIRYLQALLSDHT